MFVVFHMKVKHVEVVTLLVWKYTKLLDHVRVEKREIV